MSRTLFHTSDRELYRTRNLVERFFNRIRHFRRVSTRYDKLADSYLVFASLFRAFAPVVKCEHCQVSKSDRKAPMFSNHVNLRPRDHYGEAGTSANSRALILAAMKQMITVINTSVAATEYAAPTPPPK